MVHNGDSFAAELNNDLAKLSHWAQQWKMSFNPDCSKQAREVIFRRKDSRPSFNFHESIVYQITSQKHLGIILENCLTFEEHLRLVFSKINRTIGLLRKLQCLIPRYYLLLYISLLTIYKTFVRLHLDYGDIIYEKASFL